MKANTLNKEGTYTGDQALRVTALFYLNEALTKERYEECAELIAAAKRFGATPRDIKAEITRSLRKFKRGGTTGLPVPEVIRRRF